MLCQGRLAGDCDDAATLAAALLVSLQFPCSFIAIRLHGSDEFSHVWARTVSSDGAAFLDIDPIVPAYLMPIQNYAEAMEVLV